MLVIMLTACKNDEHFDWVASVPFDIPEFNYSVERTPFPEFFDSDGNKSASRNHIIKDDKIYFTAVGNIREYDLSSDNNDLTINKSDDYIFSLDINTMEPMKLPAFKPSVPTEEFTLGVTATVTEEIEFYRTRISALYIDNDGNFFIIESIMVEIFSFPEGFLESLTGIDLNKEEMMREHLRREDSQTVIRKLDHNGSDLIEPIHITEIFNPNNHRPIFLTDNQGNIFLGLNNRFDPSDSKIYIMNQTGGIKFNLAVLYVLPGQLLLLPNGNVAYLDIQGEHGSILMEIDIETEAWGVKTIMTPNKFALMYQGNADYPIFWYNSSTKSKLFAFNPETNETAEIMSFSDSGITFDILEYVYISDDAGIMLITISFEEGNDIGVINLLRVTRLRFDPEQVTVLTLATLDSNIIMDREIHKAVAEFNRTSTTHIIQIIDYSKQKRHPERYDYKNEINQLSLDLMAGKIPDMFITSDPLPFNRYVSMGLFEDLYPFIDEDFELDRNSFVDGLLKVCEVNGNIYRLFPSFGIFTLIGNPYFVDGSPGWTMEEFQEVLRNNPQADFPLGNWVTSDSFFEYAHIFYINRFINRERGRADFNNRRFIQLLESVSILPANSPGTEQNIIPDFELIAEGRQIIDMFYFLNIEQYQAFRTLFGGEITFKGYPTEDGIGGNLLHRHSGVAMTVTCSDKEGAWEFIRSFLTDDWQRVNRNDYFLPLNNIVFEEHLNKAFNERDPNWQWDFGFEVVPINNNEADQIRNVIADVENFDWVDRELWYIISEESSRFFNNQITAQDAARAIQNRASIYMSEQYG